MSLSESVDFLRSRSSVIVPLYLSPRGALRPPRLQTPYHLRPELITIERDGRDVSGLKGLETRRGHLALYSRRFC